MSFPIESIVHPTYSDLQCAGFVEKQKLPDASYVAGGLDTPNTAQYAGGESHLSERQRAMSWASSTALSASCTTPIAIEEFDGQASMLKAMGQPYAELAMVRVVDTRSKSAIAHIEFSCAPVVPGDLVTAFVGQTCAALPSCHTF